MEISSFYNFHLENFFSKQVIQITSGYKKHCLKHNLDLAKIKRILYKKGFTTDGWFLSEKKEETMLKIYGHCNSCKKLFGSVRGFQCHKQKYHKNEIILNPNNIKISMESPGKHSGIYKITNKTNNKVYVGSTTDFKFRWNKHLTELNSNYHHCKHLQNSFNKHSIEAFEFSILEEITQNTNETDKEFENKLLSTEQKYIDLYNTITTLYNSCKLAGRPR